MQGYYNQAWAEQLWDALVCRPALPSDAAAGLRFAQDGASSSFSEFLCQATKMALLDARMTRLPPGPLSAVAWQVFHLYFVKASPPRLALC